MVAMVTMASRKNDVKDKPPRKRQMLVYLPTDTITALKIAGVEDGVPVTAIIEELATRWLARRRTRLERKTKSGQAPPKRTA